MSTPKATVKTAAANSATLLSEFERSLELTTLSKDTFTNAHQPFVLAHEGFVAGSFTMSQSSLAAYQTVPEGFILHYLQSNFLASANAKKALVYRVQRLSTGKNFAVRFVTVEQDGVPVVSMTVSFTKAPSVGSGPFLEHAVPLSTQLRKGPIELDDLLPLRTAEGPFICAERLPIVKTENSENAYSKIAPIRLAVDGPLSSQHRNLSHLIAVVHISDCILLDAPLTLHGLSYGQPEIGDTTRTPKEPDTKMIVTLNHTIHFYNQQSFRADEAMHVEMTTPWARNGRALAHSRIFDNEGELIATCVQEGLIILRNSEAKTQERSNL